jgi:hypothetical protein
MKAHSEKTNRGSKPQTQRMLRAGLERAGRTEYSHHAPSDKFQKQSAGLRRRGDNTIADYPDTSLSNGFESTGKSGAGSRKGSR